MYPLTTPYKIIGAHVDLACATAQTITMNGYSNGIILQADVDNVRLKLSGVPTASAGFQIVAAAVPTIWPIRRNTGIQVIAEDTGALAVHQKVNTRLKPLTPVGAHVSTAVLSSEVTLAVPLWANAILVQCFTNDIRYKLRSTGGADAAADEGFVLTPEEGIALRSLTNVDEVSVIETTASATMEHQFVRV